MLENKHCVSYDNDVYYTNPIYQYTQKKELNQQKTTSKKNDIDSALATIYCVSKGRLKYYLLTC